MLGDRQLGLEMIMKSDLKKILLPICGLLLSLAAAPAQPADIPGPVPPTAPAPPVPPGPPNLDPSTGLPVVEPWRDPDWKDPDMVLTNVW